MQKYWIYNHLLYNHNAIADVYVVGWVNIVLIELCLIKILLNIMKLEGLTISSYKFHQNEQNNFFYFTFFKTYLMWLRVMVNKNEVNLACPALDLLHFSCVRDHLLRKIFRLSSSLHSFPGNIRYLAQVIYNGW